MTTTNGLLLLDKPRGLTSHDVVARVRRATGEQRVGHAGTLDPMATGLLVVALGPSTRLLRFAQAEVKRYEGEVTFGVATDSLDADGAVVREVDVAEFDPEDVNAVAASMRGEQRQTPPMVSARRVNGRRLHALAREGKEVEREPRSITIENFSLSPTSDPKVWHFDVTCSVGTYVRVLLSDLAERIGTLGHLSALRRLSSGTHDVTDALTLAAFEESALRGEIRLLPPRSFVEHLVTVVVTPEQQWALSRGQRVALDVEVSGEFAAINEAGELVAVLRPRGDVYQPTVVLTSASGEESR